MAREAGTQTYVRDLEAHLRNVLFDEDGAAKARAAVLLVRAALADGDRARARRLTQATRRLAARQQTDPGIPSIPRDPVIPRDLDIPGDPEVPTDPDIPGDPEVPTDPDIPVDPDIAAAAAHTLGLVERDPGLLEHAARTYPAPLDQAQATEDAGQALSARGDAGAAMTSLRSAYELYQRQGCAEGMARVRSQLRAYGVRLHHWRRVERPTFGWASLTDTERRIADLVSQGLSNREVADKVYLSTHTVAFHLRHIFWKLGIGSRVQLARLVAEQGTAAASR